MKVTVLVEISYFIYIHQALSTPEMSTDVSQVGVALFPYFKYIFYHFTFPGFPFILNFFIKLFLSKNEPTFQNCVFETKLELYWDQ